MSNIAFLSTAHIHTKSFLGDVAKGTDGRTTYAIWDDQVERGQRYATEFGTRFQPSLDALLADPAVDGFIICAENTRHLPLLERVLPLGKPVFCEKPLVTTVADLERVKALLAKFPQTPLIAGYFLPFSGDMQTVAYLIANGTFGKITRVRFRNAHHAAYGRWFDNPDLNWFYQTELSGGGAFMDMGTHAIHLLRSFFGPADEAFATIANHSGEYPSCDDNGIAMLKFTSGVLGTVEAAWTQTGGIGGLEIVGSKATLWNNGSGYVVGAPGETAKKLEPMAPKTTRVDRLCAVMRGDIPAAELQADLAAILDAVSIMSACYAANSAGAWAPVR